MASIFKRSKRKHEPYTIQYRDHLGKRRTARGFTDKGLTEQLAAKLETEARLRSTGLIDFEQERYSQLKTSPLSRHVEAFKSSLADNSPKHVTVTTARLNRIVSGCGFEKLADIKTEPIQTFLRSLRDEEGISPRTYNHYVQAIDSFCNWCVLTKRLIANPIAGLERLNAEIDVRRQRRALTAEEFARLVTSARNSDEKVDHVDGEQRARIYILAYMTGLRKSELASLTPRSFKLDAQPPTVTLQAACSKHRRKDVLPLHPELVMMLRQWLAELRPTDKLFPRLAGKETSTMVKADLERIGIPYRTDAGVADFHAAGRHTHITELLKNGVSLPTAKELARHADVRMTMKYTHIGIVDQAKAVANLPTSALLPHQKTPPAARAALHGRCISGGVGRHSMAAAGRKANPRPEQNPNLGEELDAVCQSVSLIGKVPEVGLEPTPYC